MSSAIWVSTGVLLAAFLAWIAVMAFPEDRSILGIKAHEQIDYNILPHNSSLANLERGAVTISSYALCATVPMAAAMVNTVTEWCRSRAIWSVAL